MSRTKQNIIVLQEPLNDAFDISLQAGNMLSNRFCIDEEAGFEFSGVYHLKGYKLCSHYNSHPSIESAFQKISEHKAKDLEPHFMVVNIIYILFMKVIIHCDHPCWN